jgi:hypothetical protein
LRRDENFVDYGKYLQCDLARYWGILQEERLKGKKMTWHHVFTGKLKKGAWQKENLSKNRLEAKYKKYRLNMDEGVYLAAAIHCILNQLLRNSSPPVVFANINYIFDTGSMDRDAKKYFTKLVLFIVEEKFERRIRNREFRSLGEIEAFVRNVDRKAKAIDADVNDGNTKSAEYIMAMFGVNREDIIYYINKNFLPENWTNYPSDLWDLYLR